MAVLASAAPCRARNRDRSRWPAATVLVVGLVLLGAAAAEAQTPRTLVSNQAQTADDSADTNGNDHAQLFHTGGHTDGYIFTGMHVSSEDADGDDFDVEICEADTTANAFPTTTCTALTAPTGSGSFAAGLLFFDHTGLALSANTNYVVVIKQRGTGSVELNSTTSGGEDSPSLSGWSIKDYFYWNNSGTWTNEDGTNEALRIIVYGYEASDTTAPALLSATVADGGDEIALVFDELIDFSGVVGMPLTRFSVTVDGSPTSFTEFGLSQGTDDFTQFNLDELDPNITSGQTVIVSYTDPTAGDDTTTVLQDLAGNDVDSFTTGADGVPAVINNLPPPPPAVTSVEFTSTPPNPAYAIGGVVETTVTFDAAVDITGTPQLELDFDGTAKAAACAAATNTTAMVCSYAVAPGDSAPNGIAIEANKLTGGTITATGSTTVSADLDHAAVPIDAGHKVDAIRPTLVTTGTDAPTTSTDGTQVILTFSEDIGAVSLSDIDVTANSTSGYEQGATVSRSGRTVTLTLLSPSLTIQAGWTVTVALGAGAVEDGAGNGNLALAATGVTNAVVSTTAPTVTGIALTSIPCPVLAPTAATKMSRRR